MPDAEEYVVGSASPRRAATAAFEFKAPDQTSRGGRGGGYPRWRSWEWRPETSRRNKEDVYVPVHRLAAVAWCLPDGTLGEDVSLSALAGMDVHHELGMPAANIEGELALLDHGEHSSRTQAERRAHAEEAKQQAIDPDPAPEGCRQCGAAEDVTLVTSAAFDGEWCLSCATDANPDAPIEL
jgi:hypothetical protein